MLFDLIGGTGFLYGGIIGAALFIAIKDSLSTVTPEYWEFWIGLLLIALVLGGRQRIGERITSLLPRRARREAT